ncbi:MAG: pilus assembly protein MshP [Gammaproteobacteria bacterium]|nr:pilus assembly protein MshP [Gammaproteobacteria bacterium]
MINTRPQPRPRGFILITVLFLIAVLAVMAVVMSSTASVQSLTSMYSLQQARALAAAQSGLEYGVQRAVSADTCTNGGITLPGVDFTVTVACTSVGGINEAGEISTVYTLSATASTGTLGNVGYVTRTLRAQVN